MPITIRPITVDEFEREPNTPKLLADYAAESAFHKLPPTNANMDMFRMLEASGSMHALGAFDETGLIGFIAVISTKFAHYGILFSTTQSFYVDESKRNTGAGVRLLKAAELHAQIIGSPGLFISTPAGGQLDAMLDKSKSYDLSNRVYYRGFQ